MDCLAAVQESPHSDSQVKRAVIIHVHMNVSESVLVWYLWSEGGAAPLRLYGAVSHVHQWKEAAVSLSQSTDSCDG